jgi:hypothetical protein
MISSRAQTFVNPHKRRVDIGGCEDFRIVTDPARVTILPSRILRACLATLSAYPKTHKNRG